MMGDGCGVGSVGDITELELFYEVELLLFLQIFQNL